MLLFTVVAMAENSGLSIADARPLAEKHDSCTFVQGDNYETYRYFSYTAKERGILSINGNSNMSFMAVDAEEKEISCIAANGNCQVPVKEGMQIYIKVCPNVSLVEADFVAHFYINFQKNDNAYRGISADDPIVLRDGEDCMTIKTIEGFTGFDTYLTYTAKETGVLSLISTGYLISKKYGPSFENISNDFVSDYESGRYIGRIPVVKGETTCIVITTYQAINVSCEMTHPDNGTIDNPFKAVNGNNSVPGEYGNYYFMYDGSNQNGFVSLTSEQALPRGYVEVFSVSDLYTAIAKSESGTYNVRFPIDANRSYIIHVFKAEDSAEEDEQYNPLPDTFTLEFAPFGPGDTSDNPIILTPGEAANISAYPGTYYYNVKVPAGSESQMLDIVANGMKNEFSQISVYNIEDGPYYSKKGLNHVKTTTTPGKTYMIVVQKHDADACTLTATLRAIIDGESIMKPIVAVMGTNNVAKDNDVYYKYEATLDGCLAVTFHLPGIKANFPVSVNVSDGEYVPSHAGSMYFLDVKKGTTYYIHLSNIEEPTTFDLDEHVYGPGESKMTAIDITGNSIVMPSGQASVWYKYTAEEAGHLSINSEDEFYGDGSTIVYFCTDADPSPYYLNTSYGDTGYIVYSGSKNVEKGDVIYFNVTTAGNFGGKKIIISLRELGKGESISNPYIITPANTTVRDIPNASRNQYRWTKVSMEGVSKVVLKTDRFVSGGAYTSTDTSAGYATYFVPDANNDICTLEFFNENNVDAIYVCFEMSGGIINLAATFTMSDGIEQITMDRENAPMFNIAGQRINAPQRGIIIKNGRKFIAK